MTERDELFERIRQALQDVIVEASLQDSLVDFGKRYFENLIPGAEVEIERPVEIGDDGVAHIKARIRPQYPLGMIQVSFSVPRGSDDDE